MESDSVWRPFILLATVLLASSHACSMPEGWRPPTTVETISQAKVVLYGRILKTYPDLRFNYGSGSRVYTAEMEVYCSLKGSRVNQRVNISEAGHIAGHCTSTTLVVGTEYVVPLNEEFRPQGFSQLDVGKLPEVYKACDLNPLYPIGVEERTAVVKCQARSSSVPCTPVRPDVHEVHDGPAARAEVSRDAPQRNGGGDYAADGQCLTVILAILTVTSLAVTLGGQ